MKINVMKKININWLPKKDANNEKIQLAIGRLYCILGIIFIPLYTILTWEFYSKENIIIHFFYEVFFIGTLMCSFFYKYGKEKIIDILFIGLTIIVLYAIWVTHHHNYSINFSFALVALLFCINVGVNKPKQILIFYSLVSVSGGISLFFSDTTEISIPFLASFYIVFLLLGYFSVLFKSAIIERLVYNETFLKTIFNKSFDAVLLVEEETNLLYDCNNKAIKLFGVSKKEEIINKHIDDINKNKLSDEKRKKIKKTICEDGVWKGELEMKNIKSQSFWADVIISTITVKGITYFVIRINDISERKRKTEALLISEEKYKSLLENMSEGVAKTDENWEIEYVNDRYCEIVGYNKEELIGKDPASLFFDNTEDENLKLFLNARNERKTGKISSYEIKIKTKDKKELQIKVSGAPVYDENKKMKGAIGIITDVTESNISKQKLLESEKRFKLLSEATLEGIVFSKQEKIIDTNDQFIEMHGYISREEVLGKEIKDFVIDDDLDVVRKYIKSGRKDSYLVRNRKKDGTIIMVESRGRQFPYGDEMIRVSMVNDVTKSKEAEKNKVRAELAEEINEQLIREIEERKNTENLLLESEKRTKTLINSSLDMIIATNKKGVITEFNKAAEKKFAFQSEEILGKGVKCLFGKPEDRFKLEEELINGKGIYTGEVIGKTRMGDKFLAYISASVLKKETGEVIGMMALLRDLTESQKTEKDLKESLRQKEVLLKEVHHRVKNNLQVISSILNLQSSYTRDKQVLDILTESQNRIKSMAFIHEHLYQANDFTNIKFSDYILNLTHNLMQSYQTESETIELDTDIADVTISLDQAIPCGLIVNELVSNALKHAFDGEERKRKKTIFVMLKKKSEIIEIEIKDNGNGLPENIDFKNTESLGLQLVMSLTEQINGEITLDKKNGTNYNISFKAA